MIATLLAVECADGRIRNPAPHTDEARAAVRDWEVQCRAMRDFIATGVPEPEAVVYYLSAAALAALRNAERTVDGYRLRFGVRDMEAGQELFSAGCVEARGPRLGVFGMKVRLAAIAMHKGEAEG